MGQWNTLHLFDETKFYDKVVPAFKEDADFLKKYFTSSRGLRLIEDSSVLTEERIGEIMRFSKSVSRDFKSYPELAKSKEEIKNKKIFFSPLLEEWRAFLFLIIFSECALPFPHFNLGYRLFFSYLKFPSENSSIEAKLKRIMYYSKMDGIFPSDMGIRSWVSNQEVSEILADFDQIKPNLDRDRRSNNKFAEAYVTELHQFLYIAKENGWGLVSCVDADLDAVKGITPIGEGLNWKKMNFKNYLIHK